MRRKNSKVAIVPLKGINTSTPDNTVEDGACEVLHNMRIKDGAWRNISSLKWLGTFGNEPSIMDVIYKHPSASEGSYVVITGDGDSKSGVKSYDISTKEFTNEFYVGDFDEVNVLHLGRLLILNIDGKMSYWRNSEDTGNYTAVSLPNAPMVMLPNKVMKANMTPLVHTRNWKGNVRPSGVEDFVTYLSPMPIYAYTHKIADRPADVHVYFPIYSADTGAFVQPSVEGDWWQGEICFFVAFKTSDGYYIRPSALNILASELDNAGIIADREIKRYHSDVFDFGFRNIGDGVVLEQGLLEDSIVVNMGGKIAGSGPVIVGESYTWINDGFLMEAAIPYTIGVSSRQDGESVARRVIANALMCAPMCRVGFENPDESIESLVLFSTRIHSRWDVERFKALCDSGTMYDDIGAISTGAISFENAFADNRLPEQPFYKILEIPRSEWGDEEQGTFALDIALTGSLLENAEQKEVWEPINPHEMTYKNGKEINSMMHIFGESSQQLFEGYGSQGFMHGPVAFCSPEWPIATSLKIDDVYYSVANRCGFDLLDASLRKNIISYPDARAKQIWNGSATVQRNAYDLQSAIANNFAYYVQNIFDDFMQYFEFANGDSSQKIYYCKYPRRWRDTNSYVDGERVPIIVAFTDGTLYGGNSVKSLSELRVSALANPLVFPLSRTYQIGSDDNKIIAINSAAIELSDEKIGEYPTWVFTSEGVFVGHWGEGNDVVYRAFLPRTYDRIANPNTLAVNGSILFITQQGLMSINDRGSQLISSPLNSLWGKTPEWLVEAKILGWKYDTNEVVVAGGDSDIYVFNLGAGLWSSRAKPATNIGRLLANNILVGGDSLTIYSIQQEGDFSSGGGYVRILTRPIKMGEYEMKRIETLIARLSASEKLLFNITIYGSIDGVKYGVLRRVVVAEQSSIRLTHVPMSVRYIKIGIEFPNSAEMTFTSLDIEYYNRFINRLR